MGFFFPSLEDSGVLSDSEVVLGFETFLLESLWRVDDVLAMPLTPAGDLESF